MSIWNLTFAFVNIISILGLWFIVVKVSEGLRRQGYILGSHNINSSKRFFRIFRLLYIATICGIAYLSFHFLIFTAS